MAKDTFYFSHDYGARKDPKLIKLCINHDLYGIGLYWCLIELLYEQGGYLLMTELETYAFELRTECERITELITEYNLFKNDGEKFWSESVLRRLEEREKRSESARNSALKRWGNQEVNANAMRTQCDGNAIKERKGKERKEKGNEEMNEEFEIFWSIYNKKVGSKKKCLAKWLKLPQEIKQKIFETLPVFLSNIKDKQFQPFPETYLNNERWNDEIKKIPQFASSKIDAPR
jgi:hypothetical protein